jgi:hypothetical protein
MRPGGSIAQTGQAFCAEPFDPLAHRAWADAYGCTERLRRLPTLNNVAHHDLSTGRRQPGILVYVHSAPPKVRQSFSNFSFLGRDRMDNLLRQHI